MNQYGHLARRHWETRRTAELATIADPQLFFTQVGEQIAVEIDRRAAMLEPRESTDDFLANLGALNEARQTAESEVLREMIYSHPKPADQMSTE